MSFAKVSRIDLPIVMDQQLLLTAKIFSELKKQIHNYVPKTGEFYIAFYPGNKFYFQKLKPFLEAEGLKYIDYSEVEIRTLLNDHHNLIVDHHPSPLGHEFYGRMLSEDLKFIEKKSQ